MSFTLALAQFNPHVGDLEGNLAGMEAMARTAQQQGADLILFPELALTGYPPEDLLLKPAFLHRLDEVEHAWRGILARINLDAVYGSVRRVGGVLRNAAVMVEDGRESGFVSKWLLPNYGVFDERRYFQPGDDTRTFLYRGVSLGLTVCEDMWSPEGPVAALARQGASLVLNLNASPFHVDKRSDRLEAVAQRQRESGLPVVYLNMVGGQDELVFDGGSFVVDRHGHLVASARFCAEDLMLLSVAGAEGSPAELAGGRLEPSRDAEREVYQALCLGLKDYVRKNGFQGVVLGLSGGIDSALTAVIAADALGAAQVEALMMPSRYTSGESLEDAAEVARRLGIRLGTVSIQPMFDAFRRELTAELHGYGEDVTEENLQPRIRATLLMALSNKKGRLLVTTGNKSEVSVGYATLYGDMAGGYSVLKDLLKAWVYRLSEARNRWAEEKGETPPIPRRVIDKAPTAELRPNQKDSDALPPYPVLDRILQLYVEEEKSLEDILAAGIDRETALQVIRLVDRNEYKRRQSPPGVRVTRKAFGKDRRYPVTNGFRMERDRQT